MTMRGDAVVEREIGADGAVNFRDLGGYPTRSGHRVAWRRVFRSGHFSDLSRRGRRVIADLGIRTVFDLREAHEVEAMPSDWRHDDAIQVVHAPRSADGTFDNRVMMEWHDRVSLDEARARRVEAYRRKPFEFTGALRELFRALADERAYPIVFHCMGGKDRTGFVAAVLLDWLGVDRDEVVADYMLTANAVRTISPTRLRSIIHLYGLRQSNLDALRAMSEVRPEYIEASLDVIHAECGGTGRYLADTVGVPDEHLAAAGELLLESS